MNLFPQSFEALYQSKDSVLGTKLVQYRSDFVDFPSPRSKDKETLSQEFADHHLVNELTGEVFVDNLADVAF